MQFNNVLNNLSDLKLNSMAKSLSEVMDLNLSTLESLYKLTQEELLNKAEISKTAKIKNAHSLLLERLVTSILASRRA